MNNNIEELEKRICYEFKDKNLLIQALTHSSFSNEHKINKPENYERLEFLGDAVLELFSSRFLFEKNRDWNEGKLTQKRSSIVCEPTLAYCARQIGIQEYIRLGKGEEATGGRNRDSITSDVLEAILGAIYLDGGMDRAKEFVYRFVLEDYDEKQLFYDSKSILQERVQKDGQTICYRLIKEEGPEHEKIFEIEVLIDGVSKATGIGKNKKAAEQQAAYAVLTNWKETI